MSLISRTWISRPKKERLSAMFGSIVSIAALAILAVTLLIVIINVLKATIRGLKKSIGTLVAIILSAVIAAILTLVLCRPESAMMLALRPYVTEMLVGMGEVFAIEALQDALIYYAVMLVAPFFFMISYILVNFIVAIAIAIAVRFILPNKKPGKVLNRLGGAGIGLVCGILVSVILLTPVIGTVSTFVSVADELVAEDSEDDFALLVKEASENTVINVYNNMGCGLLYNAFASVSVNGERVYLKDDLAVIMSIVGTMGTLTGDSEGFGEEQIDGLNKMIDDLDRSALIKDVVAEVFSAAAEKWSVGESFMGIQMVSAGELLDPILNEMLAVIATTDHTTVTADLRTMANVLGVVVEADLMSDGDDTDMLKKLSGGKVVSKLILAINENERMAHLSDQITKISVRALASTIGIPANAAERYDMLMGDIAESLNSSRGMELSARIEKVTPELTDALDTYGVHMTKDATALIVEGLINDFEDNGNVADEDIEEFFLVYHAAAGEDSSASVGGATIELLAAGKGYRTSGGKAYVGDRELKNYTPEDIESSKAYGYGAEKVDICDASSLYSADSMKSSRVTMDDIYEFLGTYSECEDVEAEAAKMDEIVSEVVSVFGDYDFDNADTSVVMKNMGSLLDKMSGSGIFGKDAVDNLLKGILQSDKVSSSLNLTTSEVTEFADDMNAIAAKEDQSYASVTTTVSQTITMIQDVNSEKTREEKKENTVQLLTNMNDDTSKMLKKVITTSLLSNHGVKETKTSGVSNMVGCLLGNMAAYDGDNKDAEAEAVNTVIDFAVNEKHDDADSLFNDEEGEGSLGVTADEFVELIADSVVVSSTVKETVYADGYEENPIVTKSLSNREEAKMIEAMENYKADKGGDANTIDTLNALAIFMNIEHSFE